MPTSVDITSTTTWCIGSTSGLCSADVAAFAEVTAGIGRVRIWLLGNRDRPRRTSRPHPGRESASSDATLWNSPSSPAPDFLPKPGPARVDFFRR